MEREVLAYVDLEGVPHFVGRLWARTRGNKESASFEYEPSWLKNSLRFSLEPALELGPGSYHTADDVPMFGAIGDSAPDRWGRGILTMAIDEDDGTASLERAYGVAEYFDVEANRARAVAKKWANPWLSGARSRLRPISRRQRSIGWRQPLRTRI